MDLLKVDSDIVLCQQGEVADQMFLLMTGKCVALVDGVEVGRRVLPLTYDSQRVGVGRPVCCP